MPFGDPLRGRMRCGLIYPGLPIIHPLWDDPDLLSFLGFEEGSGDKASDAYTWTMGDPTKVSWVTGKVGKALQFNGLSGSYIQTPCGTDFRLQVFSVAVWVKIPSDVTRMRAVYAYEGPDDGVWLILDGDTGKMYFTLWIPGPNLFVISTTDFRDDAWHHIVVTWDGTNLILYVDNQVEDSETQEGVTIPYSRILARIGAGAYSPLYRFIGIIDEFYLFKRVLTASEIALLYEV